MNTQAKIDALNDRLKRRTPSQDWLPDRGETLQAGQVWTVAGGCGDQPVWYWLLLEPLEQDLFNCAPLASHGELAGMEDLIIPLDRTQLPSMLCLGMESTFRTKVLGECLGRLPDDILSYIMKARRFRRMARNAYRRGRWWDEVPSARYRCSIAAQIERFQEEEE